MAFTLLTLATTLAVGPAFIPGPPVKVDRAVLARAIRTYAPILVLHKDEKYLPTCVESLIKVTESIYYQDRDDKKYRTGLKLIQQSGANPNLTVRTGDPDHAKAYVNVKVGPWTTEIQYWFLYAYNGPGTAYLKRLGLLGRYEAIGDYELGQMGIHEGDWEHITVRIDNRTGATVARNGVYMAAHGSGGWFDAKDASCAVKGETRLRVYASKNGHATYPTPERHYNNTVKAGVVEFRLLNDCESPGRSVDYRDRCEIMGLHGDPALAQAMAFQQPVWVTTFQGRWGRIMDKPHPLASIPVLGTLSEAILKAAGALDELTFEAGPYPPWAKGNWTGPE